jgi:hypothetical protein
MSRLLLAVCCFSALSSFAQTSIDEVEIGRTKSNEPILMTLNCIRNLKDLDTSFFRQNQLSIAFPQSSNTDRVAFRFLIRGVKSIIRNKSYEVKIAIYPVTDKSPLFLKYSEVVIYKMTVKSRNQIKLWKCYLSEL